MLLLVPCNLFCHHLKKNKGTFIKIQVVLSFNNFDNGMGVESSSLGMDLFYTSINSFISFKLLNFYVYLATRDVVIWSNQKDL